MTKYDEFSRRTFLKGTGATLGTGALASLPLRRAFAAAYPERNINVIIPTREGGGADRLMRAFGNVWKTQLKTNFETTFVPAASGRAAYEQYMGKREPDGYNLLFGNMGPEVLNWVVQKPTFDLKDFTYFLQVDIDPSTLFISPKGKFKTIDEIVAEGKKRTLTVATSRLAHPASIGMLLLAEQTGMKVNLVPFSGGRNTIAAVTTGETDIGVLPMGGLPGPDAVKIAMLFMKENKWKKRTQDAPTMNAKFNMNTPSLISARAFGIHVKAMEKFPDRFKLLQQTAEKVFKDPAFPEELKRAAQDPELIAPGGIQECQEYSKQIADIGERYKALMTGKPAAAKKG